MPESASEESDGVDAGGVLVGSVVGCCVSVGGVVVGGALAVVGSATGIPTLSLTTGAFANASFAGVDVFAGDVATCEWLSLTTGTWRALFVWCCTGAVDTTRVAVGVG
jgi:hypothetical protein